MDIDIEQAEATAPVTIMRLAGELDASNYQEVIASAERIYVEGARNVLLDLSDLSFMASSGLVALQSIALILKGEEPPDPEFGWSAFHSVDKIKDSGLQQHFKLLNPQAAVAKVLDVTGFNSFLEIHEDIETALASF